MGPLAELAPLVEAGGVLGVLGIVIAYVMVNARRDRQDYRAAIIAERQRTLAAETALDVERAARRKAEDDAEKRLDELEDRIRALRREIAKDQP